jgi:hypothetical protein
VIGFRDDPPEPARNRRAVLSRRCERAFIALCLAVLTTIVVLLIVGVIPLWIVLGTTSAPRP